MTPTTPPEGDDMARGADHFELLEILDEEGRQGHGPCKAAAATIRALRATPSDGAREELLSRMDGYADNCWADGMTAQAEDLRLAVRLLRAPAVDAQRCGVTRDSLFQVIDSPTVAALANVFAPRNALLAKANSEQIVDILAAAFASGLPPLHCIGVQCGDAAPSADIWGARESLCSLGAWQARAADVLYDEVVRLRAALSLPVTEGREVAQEEFAQASLDYELSQHIGWLKQYVQGMTEMNWRDLALRAERQLEELSEALALPSAEPSPAKREPTRWPAKGDLMTFVGKNGYPHQLEAALKIFTPGEKYRVHKCDVGDFSHSIEFDGVKGWFNGVMFELASPISSTEPL